MNKQVTITEFMVDLQRRLIEERKVSESTAVLYIRNLWTLNDDLPYKNLAFLRKTEAIMKKLDNYAPTTRKTYLASIVSILDMYKDKRTYKKLYLHYHGLMMSASDVVRNANESGEKTITQKNNWIEWETILKVKNDLYNDVLKYGNVKSLTSKQYNEILSLVVLSLYTEIPPRRNFDYTNMFVVGSSSSSSSKDKNYLDFSKQQFIFNTYKTSKKYGTQIVDIPKVLFDTINIFLKHHPLHKGKITKNKEFRFLVYESGAALHEVNAITRILNKIFKKNVGSSMIRHIYLTSKYSDVKAEQEKDANAMGHSVSEQQGVYVKK